MKIRSKKVHRNNVDILFIEVTPNKVPQNDADFSPIEIILKMSVKMTWKIIDIFFSIYRRNIDIEWTSIRRVVHCVVT